MKKLIFLIATAALVASCGATSPEAKLIGTSTHTKVGVVQPVVAVFADLEVSPQKISFFYLPNRTVVKGGYENVVDSAVREALASNGDADVLVGLETQVKYNAEGEPESITVSGYPAKYVNFRSPGDDYLKSIGSSAPETNKKDGALSLGKFKLGK